MKYFLHDFDSKYVILFPESHMETALQLKYATFEALILFKKFWQIVNINLYFFLIIVSYRNSSFEKQSDFLVDILTKTTKETNAAAGEKAGTSNESDIVKQRLDGGSHELLSEVNFINFFI